MPYASSSSGDPKWSLVVEEEPVKLRDEHSEPGCECKACDLERVKPVASGDCWWCEVGCESRCLHDGKAQSDEDVRTSEQGDWGECYLERYDKAFDLNLFQQQFE
jgi:hypothetical protein